MPANLPDQAKAKWAEAASTKDPKAKLVALKEFYSSFPKHKGTERLEMSIKRQISSLQEELERAKSRRRGSSRLEWVVKKTGLIQMAVMGTFQTATSFFNQMTGLRVQQYESLLAPVVGILQGASTQFQLILTPFDPTIGDDKQERFMNLARNADAVFVILNDKPIDYIRSVQKWFEEHNIETRLDNLSVEVFQTTTGGLRIVGKSERVSEREILEFLNGYKIRNAVAKVSRDATLDDVEAAVFGRTMKEVIYIVTEREYFEELNDLVTNLIYYETSGNKDSFALVVLRKMGLIRVLTKGVGERPVNRPLVMSEGSKVIDVAEEIHKDLVRFFRYARIWRNDLPVGTKVGRAFPLRDGDIVEIHAF